MENSVTLPSLYKVASDWAKYTGERLGESILKKNIGKSQELIRSIKSNVFGGEMAPEKIVLSYLMRGKFVDMGVGKGQKLGDIKGNREVLAAAGLKGRRAKKWYSKTIYAETNKLADILKNNYGKQATNMIKENIPSQINMQL